MYTQIPFATDICPSLQVDDDDENFDIEDVHDDFLLMDEVLCCEF